jgi:hypothetical protein
MKTAFGIALGAMLTLLAMPIGAQPKMMGAPLVERDGWGYVVSRDTPGPRQDSSDQVGGGLAESREKSVGSAQSRFHKHLQ